MTKETGSWFASHFLEAHPICYVYLSVPSRLIADEPQHTADSITISYVLLYVAS